MSEAEKKEPSVQELITSLPARIFKRDALLLICAFIAGGALYAVAKDGAKAEVTKTVDAGVAPLRKDFDAHVTTEGQAVQQLQLDVADLRRQAMAKEERDAARFDLLYKTILTRQPQPEAAELAAPARDGGR